MPSSENQPRQARIAGACALLVVGLACGAIAMRQWMLRSSPSAPANSGHAPAPSTQSAVDAHSKGDGHSDHSESEEGRVWLSPEAKTTFGIEIAEAGPGQLERTISLPGEVRLNADKVAHIVPRVSGMVREVRKNLGDVVSPGEVIAVLDSRELADAKAADLAAASRHELAILNVRRIEKLFEKKIAPEEELLRARQVLAETDIDHRTAEAKLHALGLTREQIESLHEEKDADYSRYEIKAPFAGVVLEKHITLGEVVNPDTSCFVLADLGNVWVDVTLYPQDIPSVAAGQPVDISAAGLKPARGEVVYVSPKIDEATRTGIARAVLPNSERRWRPGMFVRADLIVSAQEAPLVVPNSAIQTIENETVVFVEEHDEFRKRPVLVGRTTGGQSEIIKGLNPGEKFAASGTFILKAELGKSEAEHEH